MKIVENYINQDKLTKRDAKSLRKYLEENFPEAPTFAGCFCSMFERLHYKNIIQNWFEHKKGD
jgi:hypothetical protein